MNNSITSPQQQRYTITNSSSNISSSSNDSNNNNNNNNNMQHQKIMACYDSYGQAAIFTQSLPEDLREQEADIPTIVLKLESAIHSVDMFLEQPEDGRSRSGSLDSTSSNHSSSSRKSISSSSNSNHDKVRVVLADYNAMAQTLLYSCDESISKANAKKCNKLITGESSSSRAAYLSATVLKERQDSRLGMGIQKVHGILKVSSFATGCLLSDSPFQVGDNIVSINNVPCANKSVSAAAKLLTEAIGPLTIIVENPTGDPTLVESMVMKATQQSKVGLGVAPTTACQLKVSSISPKGLFANSLLNRRDRILSINHHSTIDYTVDVAEAASIIASAERTVTVIARRQPDSAAVVALESSR